jgi:hypothetical protein
VPCIPSRSSASGKKGVLEFTEVAAAGAETAAVCAKVLKLKHVNTNKIEIIPARFISKNLFLLALSIW